MNKLSLKTKLIAGLVTGGVILSSVSFAFAASNSTGTTTPTNQTTQSHKFGKTGRCNGLDMGAGFKTQLKAAVIANIITQQESDKILAYKLTLKENKEKPGATNKPVKHDMFSDLVTNNIISQAKADALKANFQSQRTMRKKQDIDTKLKAFVTDNTITQDQATKIATAITAAEATKKVARNKAEGMTKAERKTYFNTLKGSEVNLLKALVTNGTITQAQADKLVTLSHKGGRSHDGVKNAPVAKQ